MARYLIFTGAIELLAKMIIFLYNVTSNYGSVAQLVRAPAS